jgi:hypothetical protein
VAAFEHDAPTTLGSGSFSASAAGKTIAEPAKTQVLASPPGRPESTRSRSKKESRPPLTINEAAQIGRFGLIREIARGGMGQVFLARDTKLGRRVAIKFLLHADPNFVGRFLVEARATARCTHENIVTIFEVGEHQGLPFMVLEYLEGKTMSQLLEQRPTVRTFVELIVPVVRALERAHEHGIVHRDLKPSNIFVTDRGQVKVLDFGVAKCFDQRVDAVAEPAVESASASALPDEADSNNTYVTFSGGGTMVGTLPYMSPEQWGIAEVDAQSDLWAIGIMFWRALTGVHPAGTMNPEKLRDRITDLATPLPGIATREPGIPAELAAIVDRCLAKRKSERYADATTLLADLQAFLAPKAEKIVVDCPYRGLAAFGESDAKFFFGRSAEIRTALSHLDAWPLLAVIGPSGVGKSSFVHAGLVPAIRASGGAWQVRVVRPGRSPMASLVAALAQPVDGAVLRDSPGQFGEALRREAAQHRHQVLIVVDQLEELFTLSDDDAARAAFLAALLAAADDPSAPVRVVLSMRADFLDRLATHKQFLADLSRGLFFLSAPDEGNLRETLVRPAELAGFHFEDDALVAEMLEAGTSRGALPLLQFAATRLWDARDRQRKELTRAAFEMMGGVGGAFARHADEVAAAVPPSSQPLLRAILTRLVTPEGTRAVVDYDELLGLANDQSDVTRVVDQLVRARLIHLHTGDGDGATVEIVHEVLITEWPTLRRWLEDSHALRGFMGELRQATKQWRARGKSADLVWRGATAQEALAISHRHVLDLAAGEREFLVAVGAQAARGRRRKVFAFASVVAVLGLVIAGGAVAFVRISAAEKVASDKAAAAETESGRARAAEAQVSKELARVKEEEQARAAAEEKSKEAAKAAADADQAVALSKEQLQAANAELKKALAASQQDKVKAQELAKTAAAAAETAKKAQAQATTANAELQAAVAREREHVKQLELERSKIATGGLH